MSRSPEAKERDRLAAVARRAARKAGAAPADVNKDLAKVMPGRPVAAATLGEPIPQALRGMAVKASRSFLPPRLKEAKPRGGAREGAGAPAGATVRMRVVTFKGTEAHYKAFMAAGGGAWLRGVLDQGVANGAIKVPK